MAWGSVPGSARTPFQEGRLRGTVRTGEREIWVELEPLVRSIIGELVARRGQYDQLLPGVLPVVNDDEVAIATLSTAVSAVGPNAAADTPAVSRWRGLFLVPEHVPGAMGRLAWDGLARRSSTCTAPTSASTSARSTSGCGRSRASSWGVNPEFAGTGTHKLVILRSRRF